MEAHAGIVGEPTPHDIRWSCDACTQGQRRTQCIPLASPRVAVMQDTGRGASPTRKPIRTTTVVTGLPLLPSIRIPYPTIGYHWQQGVILCVPMQGGRLCRGATSVVKRSAAVWCVCVCVGGAMAALHWSYVLCCAVH